jgi:hypothetical protein
VGPRSGHGRARPAPSRVLRQRSTWFRPALKDPKTLAERQYQLRSVADLRGAHLHAADGEIGHVDDLLIDAETWNAPYLLIDTSNWIGGKSVLVPTGAIAGLDWATHTVHIDLPRARIQEAPTPDLDGPLDRATETALAAYYDRTRTTLQTRAKSTGSRS